MAPDSPHLCPFNRVTSRRTRQVDFVLAILVCLVSVPGCRSTVRATKIPPDPIVGHELAGGPQEVAPALVELPQVGPRTAGELVECLALGFEGCENETLLDHPDFRTRELRQELVYGFDLARRRSILHAQQVFVHCLRMSALEQDACSTNTFHSQSLTEALTALKEAEELAASDSLYLTAEQVERTAGDHMTVSPETAPQEQTVYRRAQEYLAFAEQRIVDSVGNSPEASIALYGLARAELVPSFGTATPRQLRGPKAVALLQAACRVDPSNSIASNELGLLLGRAGRLDTAEALFRQSLASSSRPELFNNLAVVYQLKGQHELARQTWRQLQHTNPTQPAPTTSAPPINWVTTAEFSDPATTSGAGGEHSSLQVSSVNLASYLPDSEPQVKKEPDDVSSPSSDLEALPRPADVSNPFKESQVAVPLHPTSVPLEIETNVIPCPSSYDPCFVMPSPRCGILCGGKDCCGRACARDWDSTRLIPWEVFAQGDYVGHPRVAHVPEYRLRVDDQLEFVYRLTSEITNGPYRVSVGDVLRIESATQAAINREVTVQPDGNITAVRLGQMQAAGMSIEALRLALEEDYAAIVARPAISVLPVRINSGIEELRAAIEGRAGIGGQTRNARVTPDGTVQLPGIGSVPAQGLTLDELSIEIDIRNRLIAEGIEITPVLVSRAPCYLYVLGEARAPGRYSLEGPTSITQAIALAGGWNVGADLRRIVVLRRDQCWRLKATQVCLHEALYGKNACPDDLWLADGDVVMILKRKSLMLNEAIETVFTRGIYGVVPFGVQYQFTNFKTF